jgi:hypothetical protein
MINPLAKRCEVDKLLFIFLLLRLYITKVSHFIQIVNLSISGLVD